MAKLWGGRFTGATDPLMTRYNESLSYDKRMYAADIQGSITYSRALQKVGILDEHETSEIERGLKLVLEEWKAGTFAEQEGDEDIHTANERRLGEIIGTAIAGKLHTGRSRNDQVATDMRLYLRSEIDDISATLTQFLDILAKRAAVEIDVLMPGYTHLQRAQPIRWSHFLMSHATNFLGDLQRIQQLRSRVNRSPLGSGALAGNPFNVDRDFIAQDLGFEGCLENSLSAVSDRDFVAEFLMWSTLLTSHISKFAEDLIIYSTAEFGFVKLSDAYSTGSSLMPQKKNPDSLELLRGKSGRVFGQMSGFLMTLKGVPSTYNKDLQEDKEPLFDCIRTVADSLGIFTGVVSTLNINKEKMLAALDDGMLATDLADYLVRKGVPFRKTHHISGECVKFAEETSRPMRELTLDELQKIDAGFEEDIMQVWNFEQSVEKRTSRGGTSRAGVEKQIALLKEALQA
ncbi:argininosuccinate lyase [Protomyces lactucae-debilis]|uniref:argininosuccinate lyase n=1 Tax=Protomyces lactucae-debilis TaxID=2754530 RepID=A0A1Y2FV13_PROLT|nr:argininosuccinate lyase [Protomyces lactucae-debilis]ORY87016.1 argininosuccinate lyase [Protomyces lactucae-debilis]